MMEWTSVRSRSEESSPKLMAEMLFLEQQLKDIGSI